MADRAGQQFGAYQLTSLLAESPIAEVYRGEQRYSHIDVTIKLLRRPLATTEEIDLFRSEARTLAALINPHIVRVLSFDVQNQIGFLVMDFVPGGTLRQHHPSGEALPMETILPYTKQVADALQYAHDQGVIHQALRPENLLVGHQDEMVLAGFHLASAYPPAENETTEETNSVSSYLAPEQLQKKPAPASDQYALGIIIYEWLSGIIPFQGSGIELVQQILKSAPAPLHGGTLIVASAVEQVVMRALAKDPAKRFASIQAFAAALEEAAQAAPAPQPSTTSAAVSAPASRRPVAAGYTAAAQPGGPPAPQSAAYPPAGQVHARTPSAQGPSRTPQPGPAQPPTERFGPPPSQAWQRQPAPNQASARPPAWHRSPAPTQSGRSSNAGCIVAIVIVVVIALIYILANTH